MTLLQILDAAARRVDRWSAARKARIHYGPAPVANKRRRSA